MSFGFLERQWHPATFLYHMIHNPTEILKKGTFLCTFGKHHLQVVSLTENVPLANGLDRLFQTALEKVRLVGTRNIPETLAPEKDSIPPKRKGYVVQSNPWIFRCLEGIFVSGEVIFLNISKISTSARWWFQKSFIFTPGEMIQFDDPICLNHLKPPSN